MNAVRCFRVAVLVFAILCGFAFRAFGAPPDTLARKQKSPSGAMFRSLVLPGWGQFYNKKYSKAIFVFGVEAGLALGASYQNDQMHRFDKMGDAEVAKFYRDDRNRLIWWLAGFVLFSMGDAYVDAHLFDYDISPKLSLSVSPAMELTLRWNVPKPSR